MSIAAQNLDRTSTDSDGAHDDTADMAIAETHAAQLPVALGLNLADPGLVATPGQMVWALGEMTCSVVAHSGRVGHERNMRPATAR
jgi:hypothetical protein